jgi:hypothetical protein
LTPATVVDSLGMNDHQEVNMATTTIEAELLDLEKRYWQALKDQDVDMALSLTDDPASLSAPRASG